MSADISVVICTYNRHDILTNAITSIERQTLAPSRLELIIVDNSSDRGRQEEFRDNLVIGCPHQYITEGTPGLSRARNIGIRAAASDIVAFMDDDAEASPHWAEALVEIFAGNAKAGIAGGPVQPIWPSSRPAWLHPWLEGFLTIVDRGPMVRPLAEGEWLAGTNIAFRKHVIEEAGLFDEKLGRLGKLLLSSEELALTRKIAELGYQAIYSPAAQVMHRVHGERVSQAWLRRRVFWQTISDLLVDKGDTEADSARDIDTVLTFLSALPSRHRGAAGLFVDFEDPDLVYQQKCAIEAMVRLTATDGRSWKHFLGSDPS